MTITWQCAKVRFFRISLTATKCNSIYFRLLSTCKWLTWTFSTWTACMDPSSLGRGKISFKLWQNEHDSIKKAGEKGKKPATVMLTWKFHENLVSLPTYTSLHLLLTQIKAKTFPLNWNLVNTQQKKGGHWKSEQRGEGKKWKTAM